MATVRWSNCSAGTHTRQSVLFCFQRSRKGVPTTGSRGTYSTVGRPTCIASWLEIRHHTSVVLLFRIRCLLTRNGSLCCLSVPSLSSFFGVCSHRTSSSVLTSKRTPPYLYSRWQERGDELHCLALWLKYRVSLWYNRQ